jgi:DNA polymerase phi
MNIAITIIEPTASKAATAAIAEIPLVSLSDGLHLLKTSLEPITQATKGTEARDILMGQLFGVAALVRAMSARLAGGEIELADAIDFASVVAQDVAALAKSKTYLAESACAVILEMMLKCLKESLWGLSWEITALNLRH